MTLKYNLQIKVKMAMVQARIKCLVFGAYDPKGGSISLGYNLYKDKRLNHNFETIGGVRHYECSRILSVFFKDKRKSYRRQNNFQLYNVFSKPRHPADTVVLENLFLGELAEWSKAHAWKACIPQGIGGSNPLFSAITNHAYFL